MGEYLSGIESGTEIDRRLNVVATNESNFPTTGEKAALAGTYGTLGSANKFVTDTDPRMTAYIDASKYGMVGDNNTDNTTALTNAIAASMATGIPLFVHPGIYKISGQITLPNNAAAYPLQRPLTIIGSGSSPVRMYSTLKHYGGTVFDMSYEGTGGKLTSLGLGILRIEGITFIDTAETSTPWIYITNTVAYLRYNAFVGHHTGTTNHQDCIILGGTQASTDGTLDSAFSGWGTVIQNNFFDQIRRALYGRMWANAVNISYNTVWGHAGTNLENGACIEFDNGSETEINGGNVISNNMIEVNYYPYAIKFKRCRLNTMVGNTVFDPTATTKAIYFFGDSCKWNTVIAGGYDPDRISLYETDMTDFHNTIIDNVGIVQSPEYKWKTSNGMFSGTGSPEGALVAPIGSLYVDTAGSTGTTLYIKEAGTGNTGWVAK